jgi:hypothetical protein
VGSAIGAEIIPAKAARAQGKSAAEKSHRRNYQIFQINGIFYETKGGNGIALTIAFPNGVWERGEIRAK